MQVQNAYHGIFLCHFGSFKHPTALFTYFSVQLFAYLQKKQYLCSVKRKIYLLIALCTLSLVCMAETKWDHLTWRNEVRIGWGDQLFESLMWHNPTFTVTTMPATWQKTAPERYRHNQHLWAEYQYRFNYWFSLGGMADISEVGWNNVTRDGTGQILNIGKREYFYNLVIMPTIRFTYFFHPNVNIYSGIGIGVDINGGTELNEKNKNTDFGVAVNGTVLGISANYRRWFAAVDFGGMTAFRDKNHVYMAASRIINVSIGARF